MKVKAEIIKRGFNLETFATYCGVSKNTILNIVHRANNTRLDTLEVVAEGFGVGVPVLVGWMYDN